MLMSDQAKAKAAKPALEPDHVEHEAAERLKHDGALEDGGDPGILALRYVEIGKESGSGHASVLRGQVVEKGPQHDEPDHPPAQPLDRRHSCFSREVGGRTGRVRTV
jgi:hypothetical protein